MVRIGVMYYCAELGVKDDDAARRWFAKGAGAGAQEGKTFLEAMQSNRPLNRNDGADEM